MLFTLLLKCEMNCQLSQILVLGSLSGEGVVLGWLFFCSSVSVKELIEQAFIILVNLICTIVK